MTRFYQARQVYEQLPMKHHGVLPDAGWVGKLKISDELRMFRAFVKPKPQRGERWGHRVIIECTCGKLVPFGRMCQHYGRPTCVEEKL